MYESNLIQSGDSINFAGSTQTVVEVVDDKNILEKIKKRGVEKVVIIINELNKQSNMNIISNDMIIKLDNIKINTPIITIIIFQQQVEVEKKFEEVNNKKLIFIFSFLILI